MRWVLLLLGAVAISSTAFAQVDCVPVDSVWSGTHLELRYGDSTGFDAKMNYRLDQGLIKPLTGYSASVMVGEGVHEVLLGHADSVGNWVTKKKCSFRVDNTPPSLDSVGLWIAASGKGLEIRWSPNEALSSFGHWSAGAFQVGAMQWDSAGHYLLPLGGSPELARTVSVSVAKLADRAGNQLKDTVLNLALPVSYFINLGEAWVQQGNSPKAIAWFEKIKSMWPENVEARQALVQLYRLTGRVDAAFTELQALAGRIPYEDTLFNRLATMASASGNAELERRYTQAAHSGSIISIGYDERKYRVPERAYVQWIMPLSGFTSLTFSAVVEPFADKYRTDLSAGDYSAALGSLTVLRKLDQRHELQIEHAWCETRLGRYAEAKARLDSLSAKGIVGYEALEMFIWHMLGRGPTGRHLKQNAGAVDAVSLSNLAAYYMGGDQFKARGFLRKSSAFPSAPPQVRINQAFALYATGAIDSAQSVFSALESYALDYPEIWYGMALCAQRGGDELLVVYYLSKALLARNDYADALLRLASSYMKLGRADLSEKCYTRVLLFQPDYYLARQGLAAALQAQDRTSEAVRQAELALRQKTEKHSKSRNAQIAAVLRFENRTQDNRLDWVSIGTAEAVTLGLLENSSYQVAERIHVENVLRKNPSADLTKELGAGLLVMGAYQGNAQEIRLDARMVDVASGVVVAAGSAVGTLEQLGRLQRLIVLRLSGKGESFDIPDMQEEISLDAQKKLAEAKDFLYQGDIQKAGDLSAEALKIDPKALSAMDKVSLISNDEAGKRVLAVLPFASPGVQRDDQWLSGGIQEALITDMKKIAGLFMVERSQINKLLDEHALGQAGIVDEKTVADIGRQMEATTILSGTYRIDGDSIRIDATLVAIRDGKKILAKTISGLKKDVLKLEERLAFDIVETLGISVSGYEQRRVVDKDPLALKTLQQSMSQELNAPIASGEQSESQNKKNVFIGRALLVSAVLGTVVSGGIGFNHWQDRSDYENATEPDRVSRAGDQAESSWNSLLVSGGITMVAWVATAAWYAWQYWIAD